MGSSSHFLATIIVLSALAASWGAILTLRAYRLNTSVRRLRHALPSVSVAMRQSTLALKADLVEQADLTFLTGIASLPQAAPEVPKKPEIETPDTLSKVVERALATDVVSLTVAALDGRIAQIARGCSGGVLQLWAAAIEHLRKDPEGAKEAICNFLAATGDKPADQAFISVKALFDHFEHIGRLLREEQFVHAGAAGGEYQPSRSGESAEMGDAEDITHSGDVYWDRGDLHQNVSAVDDHTSFRGDGLDPGDFGFWDAFDPGALVDFIPVITIFRSGFREARLLSNGKTTIDSSFKNIAVDAVSAGGGAALGAAVGSLVFPGFGTILGGIIGAVGGRFAGNRIKSIPCRDARARHELAYRDFEVEWNRSVESWFHAIEIHRDGARRRFLQRFSGFLKPSERRELDRIATNLETAVAESYERVSATAREQITAKVSKGVDRWYHRAFGVGINSRYVIEAQTIVTSFEANLLNELLKVNELRVGSARLRALARVPHFEAESFRSATAEAIEQTDEFLRKVFIDFQAWLESITVFQGMVAKESVEFVEAERKKLEAISYAWKEKLDTLRSDAVEKCGKLG